MPMAAGQAGYSGYSYMPGYMAGGRSGHDPATQPLRQQAWQLLTHPLYCLYCPGYDPAAMQQYYQAWRPHLMAAAGATGDATSTAAAYQMQGMQQVGDASAMTDPMQAAAAAAAAHAAYYAAYAPHWAAQGAMDMSQVG